MKICCIFNKLIPMLLILTVFCVFLPIFETSSGQYIYMVDIAAHVGYKTIFVYIGFIVFLILFLIWLFVAETKNYKTYDFLAYIMCAGLILIIYSLALYRIFIPANPAKYTISSGFIFAIILGTVSMILTLLLAEITKKDLSS